MPTAAQWARAVMTNGQIVIFFKKSEILLFIREFISNIIF